MFGIKSLKLSLKITKNNCQNNLNALEGEHLRNQRVSVSEAT